MLYSDLGPDEILDAVEKLGCRCTGELLALNSYENRVYEVALEEGEPVVAKFYRPGRWSRAAIEAEHRFIFQLHEEEIPAVPPVRFPSGASIDTTGEIMFAVFPKRRGRIRDELDEEQLAWIGRYVARIHNVGQLEPAADRPTLTPDLYGRRNLALLREGGFLTSERSGEYQSIVEEILDLIEPMFEGLEVIRLHGDCHLGNIIWDSDDRPLFVDFDDMVSGPPVQDIWMLVSCLDRAQMREQLSVLLEGYELMRDFDWQSLRLIEPLSALRMINYAAWIARRWEDPFFKKVFPGFGTAQYWSEQLDSLRARLTGIREQDRGRTLF